MYLAATETESFTLLAFTLPGPVLAASALAGIVCPQVKSDRGVVLSGRGPLWLFVAMTRVYQRQAPPWIGTYDPRMQSAVVVWSGAGATPDLGDRVPVTV